MEVRDLRKSFHGQAVLKGINLSIAPGEIFVIMGPSGSGKSVLLKHIIGLLEPDSGEILIQGQSVASPDIRDQFRMAMVFQSAALLTSLTVGENVGIYLAEHRLSPPEEIARIVAAKLEVVGLQGEPAHAYLDSSPKQPVDAYVSRIDPAATFTPENTYFKDDRVTQVVGVKLQLKGALGFAKPGMPADGEILVEGTAWPDRSKARK